MINEFFKLTNELINPISSNSILTLLSNVEHIQNILKKNNYEIAENYLYSHFINFLSIYSQKRYAKVLDYFSSDKDLEFICNDFIHFCFNSKLTLNSNKTLQAFAAHNQLSDTAVKKEILDMTGNSSINLLGFGLDEGSYEKELAEYLIANGVSKVNLYGIDPYAKRSSYIHYLTSAQLAAATELKFDLIIARWSLHHVAIQARWHDIMHCMKRCNSGAQIIIIEHGFIHNTVSPIEKKLYNLLNATFDIIANIGLRPGYFTQTAPQLGKNFFIQYLEREDFSKISESVKHRTKSKKIYEVGPILPNQTIFCLKLN